VTNQPTGFAVFTAIGMATWRTWFNDIVRSLGSLLAARIMIGTIVAMLAGWLVLGTYQLSSQLSLEEGTGELITTPVTAVVFVLPAFATLLAGIYAPTRTMLNDMLAVLPVRERDRRSVLRWLAVVLGLIFGGVWVLPLALEFALSAHSIGRAAASLAICLLYGFAGACTAQALFLALERLGNWIVGRTNVFTTGVAGLGVALALLLSLFAGMPMGGGTGSGVFAVIDDPLLFAIGAPQGHWGTLPLFFAVLAALPFVLAGLDRLPRRDAAPSERRFGLAGLLPARTLVGLEVRQWLRYPSNAVMLLFMVGLTLAALTVWRDNLADAGWVTGAYFVFALAGTIGVGSYGPTRDHHWLYLVMRRPLAWVAPKLASVGVIWLGLFLTYFLLLTVLTDWNPQDGLTMLPMLVVELCTSCIVGLLLPVTREQSLGGSLSESVAVIVVLSVVVGFQWLPWGDDLALYLASCALVVGLLIGGYWAIARVQMRQWLLARAS
jgi:hypothetical protein